jgi:23S rRNA pseudouridine2605 synthase
MRINQYIAHSLGIGRRKADKYIEAGQVQVNGELAQLHDVATDSDTVTLDNKKVAPPSRQTILLHKPIGYVCSRSGQGAKTIYDLLPDNLQHLKPIGRLDKLSSGAVLMTTDGILANRLTHPSYQKDKVYTVTVNKPLKDAHIKKINSGVFLEDGVSRMQITKNGRDKTTCTIVMREGKNRQIRRTLKAVGYTVEQLHRTQVGDIKLGNLAPGKHRTLSL